jgi:hypothetical protein
VSCHAITLKTPIHVAILFMAVLSPPIVRCPTRRLRGICDSRSQIAALLNRAARRIIRPRRAILPLGISTVRSSEARD